MINNWSEVIQSFCEETEKKKKKKKVVILFGNLVINAKVKRVCQSWNLFNFVKITTHVYLITTLLQNAVYTQGSTLTALTPETSKKNLIMQKVKFKDPKKFFVFNFFFF